MPNIYGLLNVGKSAITTHQKAITITGNNIANVNTPGYSRQRVNIESAGHLGGHATQMSSGVSWKRKIQRIYDPFLGGQVNKENQALGRWEAEKNALEKMDIIFNEASGYGLNQAMSEFWNAWQGLANNPSGYVERVELAAKSETMVETFNSMSSDLEQIQKDMDNNIKGTVGEINNIAEQIADLNKRIQNSEVGGYSANELRDQRDLLLNGLSSMIDINSFEGSNGNLTVLTAGGKPLVESASYYELAATNNGVHYDIEWIDSDGNHTDITEDISGGKLRGFVKTRDVTVTGYLDRFNELATTIISEVNTLHQNGYPPGSNIHAEEFFTGTSAYDMAVNPNILADVNLIAAAENSGGASGDNGNALLIAQLQNDLKMEGNTATFDDYYNSIVSDVGSGTQTAARKYDHQTSIIIHLDNYRETVSGVSIDEEMVNLVKFQHAYDAAAMLITTVDELLDTILSI